MPAAFDPPPDAMRLLIPLLLALVLAPAAQAQPASVIEDPGFRATAQHGLNFLYNMQFEQAEAIFGALDRRYPDHPAGPFLSALVPWWRILTDLSDDRHDAQFMSAMDEVVRRSDRLLRRDRNSLDGQFFKGAALGFQGRHLANRRRWLPAARRGVSALGPVRAVAEADPRNADYQFGRGIYDYFAAATPERYPWSRPFVALFPQGSRSQGLAALHRTFRNGTFLRAEAAYFLLQIYYLYEADATQSRQFITWLRQEYPQNAFFHAMEGRIHWRFGQWEEAERVFQSVLRNTERGQTGYTDSSREQALYYLGQAAFRRADYTTASRHFDRLERMERSRPESPFVALGRLRQGMIHDIHGERTSAERRYRETLALRDAAGSHARARDLLNQGYRSGMLE